LEQRLESRVAKIRENLKDQSSTENITTSVIHARQALRDITRSTMTSLFQYPLSDSDADIVHTRLIDTLGHHVCIVEKECDAIDIIRARSYLTELWRQWSARIYRSTDASAFQQNIGQVRSSFLSGFKFSNECCNTNEEENETISIQHDRIFTEFLVEVGAPQIFEFTSKLAAENQKKENDEKNEWNEAQSCLQAQRTQLQNHKELVRSLANIQDAQEAARRRHIQMLNTHADYMRAANSHYESIFETQRSRIKSSIQDRAAALGVFTAARNRIEEALSVDLKENSTKNTQAVVDDIQEELSKKLDVTLTKELRDYINDLIQQVHGHVEVSLNLNVLKQSHDQLQSNVKILNKSYDVLLRDINKQLEAEAASVWQLIISVVSGITGACLITTCPMLGGALLSSGVNGFQLASQGNSTWDQFGKTVGIGAVAGAIGGGAAKLTATQLAPLVRNGSVLGQLGVNVAAGTTGAVTGTAVSAKLNGDEITWNAIRKAAVVGALGGAVLTGAELVASTNFIENISQTLQNEFHIHAEQVKKIGSLVSDLGSAATCAALTGEDIEEALRGAAISTVLTSCFTTCGSKIREVTQVEDIRPLLVEDGGQLLEDDNQLLGQNTPDSSIEKRIDDSVDNELSQNTTKRDDKMILEINDPSTISHIDFVGALEADFKQQTRAKSLEITTLWSEQSNLQSVASSTSSRSVGRGSMTPTGAMTIRLGKNSQIVGTLKDGGMRMINEATSLKSGWSTPRMNGILFEIQQETTFNVDAIRKNVKVEAKTTSSLGRPNDKISDIKVFDKKNKEVIRDFQCKTGKTAGTATGTHLRKNASAISENLVYTTPTETVNKAKESVARAANKAKLKRAPRVTESIQVQVGRKTVSANSVNNASLSNINKNARQQQNPLVADKSIPRRTKFAVTKTPGEARTWKNIGKALKASGKFLIVAGTVWAVTDNIIDVYRGNKSVSKATICVALDVTGIQLALDGYEFVKEKVKSGSETHK